MNENNTAKREKKTQKLNNKLMHVAGSSVCFRALLGRPGAQREGIIHTMLTVPFVHKPGPGAQQLHIIIIKKEGDDLNEVAEWHESVHERDRERERNVHTPKKEKKMKRKVKYIKCREIKALYILKMS